MRVVDLCSQNQHNVGNDIDECISSSGNAEKVLYSHTKFNVL